MPGTLVRDAGAPNLASGATLNAAGTTNGTAAEINTPGLVRVEVLTSTVASTGNSATLQVEIESSDSSTFASGVVSNGKTEVLSGTDVAQTGVTRWLTCDIQKRYVRAVVTIAGTAPVYTGTTVKVRERRDHRTTTDTA